jgi:hypothetical protein
MSSVVRKISIGSDYKNDAMHYSVGQKRLWWTYYRLHTT